MAAKAKSGLARACVKTYESGNIADGSTPEAQMKRFVESEDRKQGVLLPEYLDDYVSEDTDAQAR